MAAPVQFIEACRDETDPALSLGRIHTLYHIPRYLRQWVLVQCLMSFELGRNDILHLS